MHPHTPAYSTVQRQTVTGGPLLQAADGIHVTVTCATQYVGNKDVRDIKHICHNLKYFFGALLHKIKHCSILYKKKSGI